MTLWVILGLLALGLAIGAFGTLVGAGGGFILVPLLLFLYPHEDPQTLTSISLAVVLLNAGSGTAAYIRQKRIDYRTTALFAAATVPAGLVGVYVNYGLGRGGFETVFGVIITLVAIYLLFAGDPRARSILKPDVERRVTDARGETYVYGLNRPLGFVYSLGVGFLATLLGIGGGTLHVAGMVALLGIPVHVATATSHFVLALTALAGTLAHVATGEFQHGWRRTLLLGAGVVVGAQIGAALSHKVHGKWIVRLLGAALLVVGGRLLLRLLGL